jgi:predicted HicB family RNase H-like nuclease
MKRNDFKTTCLTYRGYTGSIEFSLADNCLYGKVIGLTKGLVSYEGTTLEELQQDFKEGIDDYLSYCEDKGIKAFLRLT